MKTEKYEISGMSCAACQANVERSVRRQAGVEKADVSLLANEMTVTYDPEKLTQAQIVQAVTEAGYGARAAGSTQNRRSGFRGAWESRAKRAEEVQQGMKRRLSWSIALLLPLMYLSMGSMLTLPLPAFLTGMENRFVCALLQLALALPILFLNRSFFSNGFRALRKRAPNMDTLVSIGAGASLLYGLAALCRMAWGLLHADMGPVQQYAHALYFESSAMVLTLVTVGKYLEARSKAKTSDALGRLVALAPKTATVVRDGKEQEIPAEQVAAGDILVIRPGQSIPVDGIVTEGSGTVDQSAITGESVPVEKNPGDTVISATINRNGAFRFRALRVGEDTTLAQIIRLVDDAGSSKAPIARLADKVSGVFVPVVLGIALLTLAIWLLAGKPFEFALNCAVSVLVISCPCALGLATPVAIMVGTGKAAEYGILIKSAQSLETLHTVDTVALDKTGTITAGQSVVTELISLQPDVGQTELLTLAASVEMGSEHPLAAAVLEKAGEAGIVPQRPARFEMLAGRGVRAEVDGHVCLGGNEALLAENGIAAEQAREALDRLTQAGKTPLLFARDGTLLGVIAVADAVRETSRRAIEGMRQMGLHTVMLTGDNARTAEAIRREVGVDEVIAGILPAEKEACIRRLQAQGHRVAMVGDGINDAPALTRAEIGVAIGAGTDIAIDSADVVLMKNDLCDVLTAFRLSRAVIRNIHEDLFWAFFYNVLGIPLAAGALYPAFGLLLSPMIGAAAMSLSSVCVITNALRLRRFHDRPARGTIPAGTRKRKEKQKMITITLGMEGMACGMCEAHVNDAIRNAFPVASVESSHTKKQTVIRTEREISEAELHRVLDPTGYRMVSFRRTQD